MKQPLPASTSSQKEKDLFWMKHALALAKEAAEHEEVPVGAIVVHNDIIIGAAHNLRETEQNPIAHAETLAIIKHTVSLFFNMVLMIYAHALQFR